jgi:AraC-like DNA-binding protein
MTDPENSTTVRFSTADFPENMRLATLGEHYGQTVFKADIVPGDDASFESTVALRALPGLKLLSGSVTVARLMRTRAMIADASDDLSLVVNRTGKVTVSSRGRKVTLGANDAVLVGSDEPQVCDRHCSGQFIALRIPHAILSPMIIDVDAAIMHHIPGNTALRLLTGYADTLLDDDGGQTTPALRHRVATHVHDLVALALGATRDAEDIARSRGMGAARLRAAKIHTMENIGNRDISIGSVAAHLGMSQRHLQRLFESDGTTFAAFLLSQRLARAYRMLCEPQSAQRHVSAIAYDAGFGDLSYFNRSFRRLYGASPKEIRDAFGK